MRGDRGPRFRLGLCEAEIGGGGYPDDQRTFFSPRDDVHGLLAALLNSAQHSIVVNMYGYDDDELNKIIQAKLTDANVYVQMSLDRIQAAGAHEKQILFMLKQMVGTKLDVTQLLAPKTGGALPAMPPGPPSTQ
ncbi:MAG TPA: hypothetical protein VLM11_22570 [Streptosporangiaceae bacterium]|nr:hypothetical protein [Streptosporangiaceae bacterium]